MPRTFLVLSLGMDSNSIFSGFAKKHQQAFLAPLSGKEFNILLEIILIA